MINLKPELNNHSLKQLLTYAIGPSLEGLTKSLEEYQTRTRLFLFGFQIDQKIVGCIGIEMPSEDMAIIRHIAVFPDSRERGIGSQMIEEIIREFSLKGINAETDSDAVGFYRHCDFQISSLGEKYPGVERFLCKWTSAEV